MNLAALLRDDGQTSEALAAYGDAIRVDADNSLAQVNYAKLAAKLGRTAEAVRHFREALRIDPTLRTIADLPPGWTAWREHVGGDWHRFRNEQA